MEIDILISNMCYIFLTAVSCVLKESGADVKISSQDVKMSRSVFRVLEQSKTYINIIKIMLAKILHIFVDSNHVY